MAACSADLETLRAKVRALEHAERRPVDVLPFGVGNGSTPLAVAGACDNPVVLAAVAASPLT